MRVQNVKTDKVHWVRTADRTMCGVNIENREEYKGYGKVLVPHRHECTKCSSIVLKRNERIRLV